MQLPPDITANTMGTFGPRPRFWRSLTYITIWVITVHQGNLNSLYHETDKPPARPPLLVLCMFSNTWYLSFRDNTFSLGLHNWKFSCICTYIHKTINRCNMDMCITVRGGGWGINLCASVCTQLFITFKCQTSLHILKGYNITFIIISH